MTEESDGATDSPIDFAPMREILIVGGAGSGSNQSAVNLTASGTLAIAADVAPRISLQQAVTPSAIQLQVKIAPVGAPVTVVIRLGSSTTGTTITLPAGATSAFATSAELAAIGTIPANTNIHLDITGVGSTTTGSDLSVLIFL